MLQVWKWEHTKGKTNTTRMKHPVRISGKTEWNRIKNEDTRRMTEKNRKSKEVIELIWSRGNDKIQ